MSFKLEGRLDEWLDESIFACSLVLTYPFMFYTMETTCSSWVWRFHPEKETFRVFYFTCNSHRHSVAVLIISWCWNHRWNHCNISILFLPDINEVSDISLEKEISQIFTPPCSSWILTIVSILVLFFHGNLKKNWDWVDTSIKQLRTHQISIWKSNIWAMTLSCGNINTILVFLLFLNAYNLLSFNF